MAARCRLGHQAGQRYGDRLHLASGPGLHRRLWPAHGRGCQILLRALHHPGQIRQEGGLRQRLGGPRPCRGDRPVVGQDHPEGACACALGHHAGRRLGPHHLEEGLRAARRQIRQHGHRQRALSPEGMEAARAIHPRDQPGLQRARSSPTSSRSSASPSRSRRPRISPSRRARSISSGSSRTTRRPSPPCRTPP